MQYVRSIGGSVSKTWNSINPATLSGAVDVIVVAQEDGALACSPFHVRFGKFSLLRPYEKKVEFNVNGTKQDYAMKLGEGGEAFFVFETSDEIPESMQTSPVVSPAASPQDFAQDTASASSLQEPEYLDITSTKDVYGKSVSVKSPRTSGYGTAQKDLAPPDIVLSSENLAKNITQSTDPASTPVDSSVSSALKYSWIDAAGSPEGAFRRSASEELLPTSLRLKPSSPQSSPVEDTCTESTDLVTSSSTKSSRTPRSNSPPPISASEAIDRALSLSKKLSSSNIPTHINDSGDLMLDMTGYKSSEDDALRAEAVARRILAEELEGNYDIGALIGADEHGNLWIYSSEEAKDAAVKQINLHGIAPISVLSDAASDPGYHSDGEEQESGHRARAKRHRTLSEERSPTELTTPLQSPPPNISSSGESSRNYAKTLRLTSDQLKALKLKPGPNTMSFSVNKATCNAYIYYWTYDVPIVISDIDGTITKSDALGHVLNMIGRDWTHLGVAKLYTDIVANGYNILYLTSRSVGQADTTRTYLNGVSQEGFKLPKGPVIMSPDRTMAALRREIYLRKPEIFKMSCLRDILTLFSQKHTPFYAGFGNRFTDALSYRSVNIPSTRIFTINSNAEVSLDLLTLNKYKNSYVTMRELVDHFFPPVGLLVAGGGEEFTDFNYWRDTPLGAEDFSDSDDESESDGGKKSNKGRWSIRSEDEGSEGLDDTEMGEELGESYISRESAVESGDVAYPFSEGITDERHLKGGLAITESLSDLPSNSAEIESLVRGEEDSPVTENENEMFPRAERLSAIASRLSINDYNGSD